MRAIGAVGAGDDLRLFGGLRQGGVEIVGLIHGEHFSAVAEEQIDMVFDQRTEGVTVAVYTERVAKRDGDAATGGFAGLDRLVEGRDGGRAVEAVALQIDPVGIGALRRVDIIRPQKFGDAQIGVHRAFTIRRDQHDAAPGFGLMRFGGQRGRVIRPLRAQVMGENFAQLVVLDLAHIGGFAAQMRDARDGVGGRPAGDFLGRPDLAVQLHTARLVGELHDPLLDAVIGQKLILAGCQHINHCVADADDLISFHRFLSSKGQMSRIRQLAHKGLRALHT